jgi:hypothetical protein
MEPMEDLQIVRFHLDRAAEEMAAAERSAHDSAARAHSKLAFLHNVRARELSSFVRATGRREGASQP